MVDRFLRQPAGGGQQGAQLAAQEGVDRQVGGADRAARHLLPAFEGVAVAGPLPQRDPAGFGADFVEARAVDHCTGN